MRSDRNHEGYRDPTAAQAILRASVGQKEERELTYKLKEVKAFIEAVEKLRKEKASCGNYRAFGSSLRGTNRASDRKVSR